MKFTIAFITLIYLCNAKNVHIVILKHADIETNHVITKDDNDLPEALDWRDKGIILPVVDQVKHNDHLALKLI
jgi:hypothetical protein